MKNVLCLEEKNLIWFFFSPLFFIVLFPSRFSLYLVEILIEELSSSDDTTWYPCLRPFDVTRSLSCQLFLLAEILAWKRKMCKQSQSKAKKDERKIISEHHIIYFRSNVMKKTEELRDGNLFKLCLTNSFFHPRKQKNRFLRICKHCCF